MNGPPAVGRPAIGAEQLRNLYLRQGLTARQVADELACEPAVVRAALKRHRITRPPVSTVLEVDRDTLTRLYAAERLDDRVIAARYGVPTWRVARRRRELNIVRQRASRARAGAAPSRPGPEVSADRVVHQPHRIADRAHPDHVRHVLHVNGIRATTDPGFSPWVARTARWTVRG